jgi:hypothetical protein
MRNKVVALVTAVAIGTAAMTTGAPAAGHGGGGGGGHGGFGVAVALAARVPVLAAGILAAALRVRTPADSPGLALR